MSITPDTQLSQLMKLLNRSLIVYPEQNGGLGAEQFFFFG